MALDWVSYSWTGITLTLFFFFFLNTVAQEGFILVRLYLHSLFGKVTLRNFGIYSGCNLHMWYHSFSFYSSKYPSIQPLFNEGMCMAVHGNKEKEIPISSYIEIHTHPRLSFQWHLNPEISFIFPIDLECVKCHWRFK